MSSNLQAMEHRWGMRVRLDAPGQIRAANGTTQACVVRRDQRGMGLEWRVPGAPAIWDLLASGSRAESTSPAR